MNMTSPKNSAKIAERAFIIECIAIYKSLPALWNLKSKEYSNRQKKNEGYEVLLRKYRERYPEATRDDVIKKFNSLRTNYRKEVKRIKDSKRSGAGTDDVEEPTLWYFKEMSFLGDQEVAENSINTIEGIMEEKENNSPNDIVQSNVESPEKEKIKPVSKKKKKNIQEELMVLACNRLQSSETEYDQIAKAWAVELQKLSAQQQVHAKKAIYNILYEGQLGHLYENSVIINSPLTSFSSTPTTILSSSPSSSQQYCEEYSTEYTEECTEETSVSNFFSTFQ